VRIKKRSGLCVTLLVAHVIALDAAYAQVAPSIERVSIGDNGQQVGPRASTISKVRVSYDGDRVLFGSIESLVSDDLNGTGDGYVRIRSSKTTERVTLRADGSEIIAPQAGLEVSDMSANGRFVVFSSFDDGVVDDGLQTTTTGSIFTAAVSDDGNIVAFVTSSADLVPGDTNTRDDVFVRAGLWLTTCPFYVSMPRSCEGT